MKNNKSPGADGFTVGFEKFVVVERYVLWLLDLQIIV